MIIRTRNAIVELAIQRWVLDSSTAQVVVDMKQVESARARCRRVMYKFEFTECWTRITTLSLSEAQVRLGGELIDDQTFKTLC